MNINQDGWPHPIKGRVDELWAEINKDNRIVNAIRTVYWDFMQDVMERHEIDTLEKKFPIGRVFFAENCLTYNQEGSLFELEPPQIIDIINPFNTVKKWSRRLSKTTIDKIVGFHTIICYPNQLVGLVERNWATAKSWLRVEGFRHWLDQSPYLLEWAGGFEVEHSITYLFGNASGIFVSPAGVTGQHFTGKSLLLVIEDEQSRHPFTLDDAGKPLPSGLDILLLGRKYSANAPPITHRISSTPNGKGTPFFISEQNSSFFRSFAPVGCPKGYERWVCSQRLDGKLCPYYSVNRFKAGKSDDKTMCCTAKINYKIDKTTGMKVPDFKGWFFRLPDDRSKDGSTAMDMIDICNNNSLEYWLQEFMGENLDFEGNAFNRLLVDKWMDGTVEEAHEGMTDNYGTIFKSERFCVAALDIGLTQLHQSCLTILEQQDNGQWHQIRCEYIQDWAKTHLGKSIAFDHYKDLEGDPGVFDIVLDMLKGPYGNYAIQYIAGDASGPGGKSEIGYTFKNMVEQRFGSDIVIPFQTLSKSAEFGGKIENIRVMKHLIGMGHYKSVEHNKLRLETLGWKMELTPSGTLKGGASKKGGKVRSDDGVMSSMMVCWLAFKYLGGADYVPEVSTGPSSRRCTESTGTMMDFDDLEDYLGDNVETERWYDDPGY